MAFLIAHLHELGDTQIPWDNLEETILSPCLDTRELADFVRLYKEHFPSAKPALDELQTCKASTFVGLPALAVTGGIHAPSLQALQQLLAQIKNPDKLVYLAQLAAAELFASGKSGIGGPLPGSSFGEDWHWLLTDPTSESHRLSAVVWAVPLLRLTAQLDVHIDPSIPGGFTVKEINDDKMKPEPLWRLILGVMRRLVVSGMHLAAFLNEVPFGTTAYTESRMPRWIDVCQAHYGQSVVLKMLFDLTRDFPLNLRIVEISVLKSWTQACVLRMQLLIPQAPIGCKVEDWADAIQEADFMCEVVQGTASENLARANRAWLTGQAVARLDRNGSPPSAWIKICCDEFAHVVARRPVDFDPKTMVAGVIKKLEQNTMRANMSKNSSSTLLFTELSKICGDSSSAEIDLEGPDGEFAVDVDSAPDAAYVEFPNINPLSLKPSSAAQRLTITDFNALMGAST